MTGVTRFPCINGRPIFELVDIYPVSEFSLRGAARWTPETGWVGHWQLALDE